MAEWILDLTKELQSPQSSAEEELCSKCIYRIPKILTDVNYQAYEPKLASFGPYHHDCRHLRQMEQHKHRALLCFLRRVSSKSSKTPEDVFLSMKKVEDCLLASYDALDLDDHYDDERHRSRHREWHKEKDEFLKLMILDGCFALEVMLSEKRFAEGLTSYYDRHDPVFGIERKNYVVPDLKRDMLLLENQLPLLALSTLASIPGSGMGDVHELIKSFYNIASPSPDNKIAAEEDLKPAAAAASDRSYHILDIYRKGITAEGEYLPSYDENMKSATELEDAGISFCRSNTSSYRDISFIKGALSLPPLEIDDTTESQLLNLMAFERLHASAGNEVTAYAFFMDGLINTVEDVAVLRSGNIITGLVGCDGNITSMFNRITKEATLVVFQDEIKTDVNGELNEYCKKRTHRWRASFMQTYLKNPWVFISLLGGLFLLALTVLQTVYTLMGYYHS